MEPAPSFAEQTGNFVGQVATAAYNMIPGATMMDQATANYQAGNIGTTALFAVGSIVDAGIGVASLGESSALRASIANEIPATLARVVPGNRNITTLGRPGTRDVFVTAADDIAGLNAAQLSQRLTIDPSDTFTVIKFPTPSSGLATPINRLDKGFIGGGRTAGGAREFVLPNQPIPSGAIKEIVR